MNKCMKKVKCEKGKTLAPTCIDNNGQQGQGLYNKAYKDVMPYSYVLSHATQPFCPALCYK